MRVPHPAILFCDPWQPPFPERKDHLGFLFFGSIFNDNIEAEVITNAMKENIADITGTGSKK
jgi:hypothetical protein